MNSYKENFQTAIKSTFNQLSDEEKKLSSQENAAQFSLYHAQGASIISKDKRIIASKNFAYAQKSNESAVEVSNLIKNVVATANSAKESASKVNVNAATVAVNIQTATAAIAKLSADIASVAAMVNAADYGSDINVLAGQVKELMDTTSYKSELASQEAMNASRYAAEIISATVATKAAKVEADVESILQATINEFGLRSESLESANNALSDSQNLETTLLGNYNDLNKEKSAISESMGNAHDELNFGLRVKDVFGDGFTVSFSLYQAPFDTASLTTRKDDLIVDNDVVEAYDILIVKSDKASTFEISDAEAAIANGHATRVAVEDVQVVDGRFEYDITLEDGGFDVDGEAIEAGSSYVVFFMVEYTLSYKKMINNYVDYLSLPSSEFTLTTPLTAATNITVVIPESEDSPATVNFDVADSDLFSLAEYRVMFLQAEQSDGGIEEVEEEVFELTQRKDELEDSLATLRSQFKLVSKKDEIVRIQDEIGKLQDTIEVIDADISENTYADTYKTYKGASAREKAKITRAKNDLDKLKEERVEAETALEQAKAELKSLKTGQTGNRTKVQADIRVKQAELNKINSRLDQINGDSKLGFIFNQAIAEAITPGNYTIASVVEEEDGVQKLEASLELDTTDNFGNQIQKNMKYIPVVLSVLDEEVDVSEQDKYTNSLSDLANTGSFPLS